MASSFLNAAGPIGRVTLSERIETARCQRRVLTRVSRDAWRLDQAERERTWALISARAEGSRSAPWPRQSGSHPNGCIQLVTPPGLDTLDAARRAAGWPALEHPDSADDTELDGRDTIAGRLCDAVGWLRQCADWLSYLDADSYPPAVNLRPSADWRTGPVVGSL